MYRVISVCIPRRIAQKDFCTRGWRASVIAIRILGDRVVEEYLTKLRIDRVIETGD